MRLIFVVARDQLARQESLRASLVGADDILIVVDRRDGQRRVAEPGDHAERPSGDRRVRERRTTGIDGSLRAMGWALVEQAP
ncbi:MAG: hypothetical protein AUH30_10350 [Candidatus Rokubacteria bacterium 13_1_40CM_68_15]|nr:MAG: hypothetical protein AUH30_10350 [Candidatus Rokubacteria bacterium 13_1_40CM_68_15]